MKRELWVTFGMLGSPKISKPGKGVRYLPCGELEGCLVDRAVRAEMRAKRLNARVNELEAELAELSRPNPKRRLKGARNV